jgi:hypothetical protein
MVTALQVFKKAMGKIDELASNGTINSTATSDYQYRAIEIINSILSNLADISENYKTIIYDDWSANDTFGDYSILDLPTDFYKEYTIEEYPFTNDDVFYIDGNNLNILTNYKGKIKLVYIANPTPITALADTLTIKDAVANTSVVYGLIAELLATENADIANLYLQKYDESKIENKPKSKARYVKRKNKY